MLDRASDRHDLTEGIYPDILSAASDRLVSSAAHTDRERRWEGYRGYSGSQWRGQICQPPVSRILDDK